VPSTALQISKISDRWRYDDGIRMLRADQKESAFQILHLFAADHILRGSGMPDQPMASCNERGKNDAKNPAVNQTV
jgi:hypothetical protein